MVNYTVKNWQGEEAGTGTLELKTAKPETAKHLIHRVVVSHLAATAKVTPPAKLARKCAAVVANPGGKKVRVGLRPVRSVLLSGVVAVSSSDQNREILRLRSIAKRKD
jgi:hypothetical protein